MTAQGKLNNLGFRVRASGLESRALGLRVWVCVGGGGGNQDYMGTVFCCRIVEPRVESVSRHISSGRLYFPLPKTVRSSSLSLTLEHFGFLHFWPEASLGSEC